MTPISYAIRLCIRTAVRHLENTSSLKLLCERTLLLAGTARSRPSSARIVGGVLKYNNFLSWKFNSILPNPIFVHFYALRFLLKVVPNRTSPSPTESCVRKWKVLLHFDPSQLITSNMKFHYRRRSFRMESATSNSLKYQSKAQLCLRYFLSCSDCSNY